MASFPSGGMKMSFKNQYGDLFTYDLEAGVNRQVANDTNCSGRLQADYKDLQTYHSKLDGNMESAVQGKQA